MTFVVSARVPTTSSVDNSFSTASPSSAPDHGGSHMSASTIAAISVSSICVVVLATLLIYRRYRRTRHPSEVDSDSDISMQDTIEFAPTYPCAFREPTVSRLPDDLHHALSSDGTCMTCESHDGMGSPRYGDEAIGNWGGYRGSEHYGPGDAAQKPSSMLRNEGSHRFSIE